MPLSTKTELNALLQRVGIDRASAEAVMEIDTLLQRWRRRAMKRELGTRALVDLGIELDLAQLDVLAAIEGPPLDQGEPQQEVMVSTVAERLNIDPSRASRIVSDLVEQNYARRAVSQMDARRTIIELTERGTAIVDAVRAYKFLVMGNYLSQWDAAELAAFVPMLKRFGQWMDGIDPATEKYAAEIAVLAKTIAGEAVQGEPA